MPEIATNSHPAVSSTLPPEVVTCLQNARFLHLATCNELEPHISLMNYTYLENSPWNPHPTIVMTTPPSSKKTDNMLANPRVSLLVHDWVTHRPPTLGGSAREGSPPPAARSGLSSLLLQMNTAALSRISTTINGTARLVPSGSEEETWLKARHLENNTFGQSDQNGGEATGFGTSLFGGTGEEGGDGGRECYIEGEEVRVIVVNLRDGRTVDWKGGAKDWVIAESETTGMANGV
jgi:hypothetical protein